jgi:GNAT superfamily N-acetyltransferase
MSNSIFQRWFNLPPTPQAERVIDLAGERFWVQVDGQHEQGPWVGLYRHGEQVGHVQCCWSNAQSLFLAEMLVFPYLRGRGLGKAMLDSLVRWARQNRVPNIWGIIEVSDPPMETYLAEWYRRQGFQVEAGRIFMELGQRAEGEQPK